MTMFIVGLLGFAIASAVGGEAPNIGTLIAARAVQGGFAAVLAPAALSLITVIFTDLKELNAVRHPLIPLRVVAGRNRGAAYLTLFLANAAVFALFLFLTYYFQRVLGYSPIMTGVAFLPMMVAIAVVATLTQGVLLQHLNMRAIVAAGLIASGAGAALGAGGPYAAWVLPGLVLVGTGIGSAVVAVAVGQQGVEPRDAGTAGALNNVSQQLGAAAVLCSALIRGGTRLHHEAGQLEPLDEIAGGLI